MFIQMQIKGSDMEEEEEEVLKILTPKQRRKKVGCLFVSTKCCLGTAFVVLIE